MTRLGDKISVPELDEARLARIESGVVTSVESLGLARLERRSRLRWPAAAVAALGVTVAIFLNLRAAVAPMLPPLEAAALPTTVVTGPGERAEVRVGDAIVTVDESSNVSILRRPGGEVLVGLDQGAIDCDVEKRAGRPAFQVRSDDVTVTVVGTAFRVERDRTVRVAVTRGIVTVESSGEARRLVAGQRWEGSPYDHVALAEIPDTPPDHEPKEATTPLTAHRDDVDLRPRHERSPTEPRAEKDDRDDAPGRWQRLEAAEPPRPELPGGSSSELGRLRQISATNPAKAADEALRIAARESGDVASFALYTRAYLQLVELEQPREAVVTASQYERRFPRGAEAESILWIRIRGLCESDQLEACRAAAYSYMRRYRSGAFTDLASRITHW